MVLAAVVEENKQTSDQLFRSIFENAQIGISFYRIATGKSSLTARCKRCWVTPRKNLVQLERWDDISHPDDRASSAERYGELVEGNVKRTSGNSA
jgi:hypothetical protein